MADYLLKNLKNIKLAHRQDKKMILQANPYAESPDYQRFDEIALKKHGISPLLIICGVENYRALQTFQRDLKRNTAVVAEPDPARLRHLLTNKDLRSFIKNNNILFVAGKAARMLGDEIEAYFSIAAVDNIFIVPPLANREKEFKETLNNLDHFLKTARTNLATMEKFLLEWHCFLAENLNEYLNSPPLNELKNSLEEQDCCLVGPGASIDEHIELLKKAARGWVIAVDTALPLLIRLNITPDFVVSVDTGEANLDYLTNFPAETTLITPPYMRPQAIKAAQITRFFEPNFPAAQWLKPEFPSPGFLALSGSVSVTALDFIGLLNPRSCLMLGIDLGYKDFLPFSRYSPRYNKLLNHTDRFKSIASKIMHEFLRYELKKVENDGNLLSSARFISWARSISFLIEQFPFPVYRPREGVLPLKNTKPLEGAKFNFNKKDLRLKKIPEEKTNYEGLLNKLSRLEEELTAGKAELNLIESLYERDKSIAQPWLSFARQLGRSKEMLPYFQWEIDRLIREMQDAQPKNQEKIFRNQYKRWQTLINKTQTGLNKALSELCKKKPDL